MLDITLYKYRLELHALTSPVSECADLPPREVIRRYADAGVHGLALTNHLWPGLLPRARDAVKFYMDDFRAAREEGERLGVRVYLGAELRFEENANDYLVYGIDENWVKRAIRYFPLGIERYLRDFQHGRSVIVQAHPFRFGMVPVPGMDGAEVFNMHPNHNSRDGLASVYAREHGLIPTAGTDYHHAGHEALGLTLSKTLPADTFELADLLRSRDYLFLLGGRVMIPCYS
jgi:predicted metal-dependent phosphoesterase TrpH